MRCQQVQIAPWESKEHNPEVLRYNKGGEYPKPEVGKQLYAIREVKPTEGRQYVRIKLFVDHDVT